MVVGNGDARRTTRPPDPAKPDPVFELGRCVGDRSTFATESRHTFDQCLVDHMRDVLAMRHEGPRTIVTASMYSDLAICASHSSCSIARDGLDPARPWTGWTYAGDAAWRAGAGAVACAMVEQGGVRIVSRPPDRVTIESEPGTNVEGCIRQFVPVEQHRIAR